MTLSFLTIFALGAFAGGFINGLAGFGTALFALGFWLHILPPIEAVALSILMSLASGAMGLYAVRGSLAAHLPQLLTFVLPALCGIPIGIWLLGILDPDWLKLVIGIFMFLYGGFFAFRRNLPAYDFDMPLGDAFVGFLSGILGGTASLSGALPTLWCNLRTWGKMRKRAILQPFNMIVLGLTGGILAVKGVYTSDVLLNAAIAVPITVIAAQIGLMLFRLMTDQQFTRVLIALMLLSGLLVIASSL